MNPPHISVVMPNYNKFPYIQKSVESILNQDYKNFDLIIVDDGSTDDSIECIKKFAKNDRRVNAYFLDRVGKVKALNYAISLAKGEYIKYFASDDVMFERALSSLVKEMRDNDILIHNASILSNSYTKLSSSYLSFPLTLAEYTIEDVLNQKGGCPSGLYFFKKSVVDRIFPIPESASYEDWYIFLMIVCNKFKTRFLDLDLAGYVQNDSNTFGGIYNFSKKMYLYRIERDIAMYELFKTILPWQYRYIINLQLNKRHLIKSASLLKIVKQNISFKEIVKILIIKYLYFFYKFYCLYTSNRKNKKG